MRPAEVIELSPAPVASESAIAKALEALFEREDVIELRALSQRGRKQTHAGYFDGKHRSELISEAVRLNRGGAAVYVTLNRIDSQLLARYANRIEPGAQATTTDANVTRRRWLLLDFDPVRPKDTSATDLKLEAAKERAREAYRFLKQKSWPDPLIAESGNGVHLLYPVDLANDHEARDLIKGALESLSRRFDNEAVKLDTSVFNAARIVKLYGTVANKGDHTPLAPWRLSRILQAPKRNGLVTPEQLRALLPELSPIPQHAVPLSIAARFDLNDFLAGLGIGFQCDTHEGRERFKLDHCPFHPEHGRGEAAIFRAASGQLGFKCQHNSCADKTWQDVRELIDGPRESRQRATGNAKPLARGGAQSQAGDATAGADTRENWPEPLRLNARIATEPYPLDALPETVRAAVSEVQGFTKAPIPLVASSALAALSLAIQAHYNIERAKNLTGPTSLYLLTIADSGERKTQCDSYFTRALRNYEKEQAEVAKPELAKYRATLEAWNVKREGIKAKIRDQARAGKATEPHEKVLLELEQDKPQSPRVPKLMRGDETPEHLAFALAHEWPSAGVMSSEAGLIFGAHGMGKDSIMRNLSLLNILWDGGVHHIGRRTSESFTVQGARLTVALQLQEATLRSFFNRSNGLARGTGFLARFLVAWPESTMGTRTFCDAGEWAALAIFDKHIGELLSRAAPIDEQGTLSPQMLTLSPTAKRAWVTFHNAVEHELRSGGELYDVRDVAAKAAENVARLAALFHIFSGDTANAISEASIESASRIVAWHLNESRRFFGELALPPELVHAARLDSWLIGYCSREKTLVVPIAKLQQFGPSGLRKRETIELALRELDELQRAKLVCNGHRKEVHINPALIERSGA